MVYLEENSPARSQYRAVRRAEVTGAIVVHTAENNTDVKLPDGGAEAVARFISTRSNAGSYHSVVDSDSVINVGKYEWEMFHEGTGGNRWSLGLSFACRASQWGNLPDWWEEGALANGAREAKNMAKWVQNTTGVTVPAKRISPVEYRAGEPGFVGHGELDPSRRSDPGDNFPWNTFLGAYDDGHFETEPTPTTLADRLAVRMFNMEALSYIDWTYRFHLKRTPSREELNYWLEVVRVDGLSAMRHAIANSDEAKDL